MGERFLLTWKRTWPETDKQDFIGRLASDPIMFARVYFSVGVPNRSGPWFWTVSDSHQIASGFAVDTGAAARAAEAAYVSHNAIIGLGRSG